MSAREAVQLARLHRQAALGLGQQILGAAEQRGARRTDLGTSRVVAVLVAMAAQLALADAPGGRIVLVLGNAEGAGGNAVAATDALVRVVADHAGHRVLGHRRHRAGRNAGRVTAMHAGGLHEGEAVDLLVLRLHGAVAVHLDQVEGIAGGIQRRIPQMIDGGKLRRVVVGFLAGRDTGLAADAQRGVVEQAQRFGRPWPGFAGEAGTVATHAVAAAPLARTPLRKSRRVPMITPPPCLRICRQSAASLARSASSAAWDKSEIARQHDRRTGRRTGNRRHGGRRGE